MNSGLGGPRLPGDDFLGLPQNDAPSASSGGVYQDLRLEPVHHIESDIP